MKQYFAAAILLCIAFPTLAAPRQAVSQPVRPSSPAPIARSVAPISRPSFATSQTTPTIGTGISPIKAATSAVQTTPGKIIMDTAGAASGAAVTTLVPNSTTFKTINAINTAAPVVSAGVTGGASGAATAATKQAFVSGAETAGSAVAGPVGAAAAAGTATASFDIGQEYIAPKVAPTIGSAMYNAAPQLFTPPTVKPSTPATKQPSN